MMDGGREERREGDAGRKTGKRNEGKKRSTCEPMTEQGMERGV